MREYENIYALSSAQTDSSFVVFFVWMIKFWRNCTRRLQKLVSSSGIWGLFPDRVMILVRLSGIWGGFPDDFVDVCMQRIVWEGQWARTAGLRRIAYEQQVECS